MIFLDCLHFVVLLLFQFSQLKELNEFLMEIKIIGNLPMSLQLTCNRPSLRVLAVMMVLDHLDVESSTSSSTTYVLAQKS